jgi:hypothetical protein
MYSWVRIWGGEVKRGRRKNEKRKTYDYEMLSSETNIHA